MLAMLKQDVFDHFKKASGTDTGTASKIAQALDISPAAVSKWGDIVPWFSAEQIERITNHAVRVRPELYERGRPIPQRLISLAMNQ
jgi:DNA-binding transcriptional regulator YdaS (Cro superfamily)